MLVLYGFLVCKGIKISLVHARHRVVLYNQYSTMKYCSLAIECPWVEHLTGLPKRRVGALLGVFTFNHERVPMSVVLQ